MAAPGPAVTRASTPVAGPVHTGSVPPRVPRRVSGSLSSVPVVDQAVHGPASSRVRNFTATGPTSGSAAQVTPRAANRGVLGRLSATTSAARTGAGSGRSVSRGATGARSAPGAAFAGAAPAARSAAAAPTAPAAGAPAAGAFATGAAAVVTDTAVVTRAATARPANTTTLRTSHPSNENRPRDRAPG